LRQKKKKTYAEIEAELKVLKSSKNAQSIALIGQSAIKYGAYVGMAYFGHLSINALAGQATVATVAFNFLSEMHVSVALGWTFGVAGIIYGRMERSLCRDVIERLSGRISKFEKGIDSRRSSSSLTARGDTPEDAI
jgi:hypothetical protein